MAKTSDEVTVNLRMMPVVKPSRVLRMVRAGKLPESFSNKGRIYCAKCGRRGNGTTDGPSFWENGMYVGCRFCKAMTLAEPRFPPCEVFPEGFVIDLTGERKKYPLIMDAKTIAELRAQEKKLKARIARRDKHHRYVERA